MHRFDAPPARLRRSPPVNPRSRRPRSRWSSRAARRSRVGPCSVLRSHRVSRRGPALLQREGKRDAAGPSPARRGPSTDTRPPPCSPPDCTDGPEPANMPPLATSSRGRFMTRLALAIAILASSPAFAATRCDQVLAAIGSRLADAVCVESPDLTTKNPVTTPANNSIPTLPLFAFTPVTDRGVISPNPPNRTPITRVVPGIQLDARIADDPTGEARFLLRLPAAWNGSLVVAGASGTRSEFNGDFAWSDYVVQQGYAYASQNKGVLNLRITGIGLPTPPTANSCRLNPASPIWVEFYDNDPAKPFTQWTQYMLATATLAQQAAKVNYQHYPRRTYAVGTSNGGYQVRRALEEAPDLFDGGVDWEGTFVDPSANNLLATLPPAIHNFPAYAASDFDANGPAAQAIRAAGYPPD